MQSHYYLQYFSISLVVLFLCFNLKAIIVVGFWVSASSRLLEFITDQSVDSHHRDGNHRHYTEEDDDGKHPVRVGLHFSLGE